MPVLGSFGSGSLRSLGFSSTIRQLLPVSLSLVDYVTGNDTTSVTMPGTIQAGDVAVLLDSYAQTSQQTLSVPTSWTSLSQTQTQIGTGLSRFGLAISYRIIPSGLANFTVSGLNTGLGTVSKVLYIFRPNVVVSSASISTVDIKLTTTTNLPTASVISGGQVHVAYWRSSADTTIARSLTPVASTNVTVNSSSVSSIAIMPSVNSTAQVTSVTGTNSFTAQTCFSLSLNAYL